jgi:RNA polymerase sigma factor (TIGR02999 family)
MRASNSGEASLRVPQIIMNAKVIHSPKRTETLVDNGLRLRELVPPVYDDLRRIAKWHLERLAIGQSLEPTALVHEAYVRLVGKDVRWDGSKQFFLAAARAIHDVLVEHARKRASLKRGGGLKRIQLEKLTIASETPSEEILALSDLLEELRTRDTRKHNIVMLRFFGGLTEEQCASALSLSLRTIEREWTYTRAWLHKRLSEF